VSRSRRIKQARPTTRALIATALSRRWVALGLVAILAAVVCALMGRWQWERTQDLAAAERSASLVPERIEEITTAMADLPNDQVGRRVILSGRYLPEYQQLVQPRLLDDLVGIWVLTPIELSDGSVQAVLRGWVGPEFSAQRIAQDTPASQVRIVGALQPYERFYADALPKPGVLVAMNADLIAERWPNPLRPGIVILQEQQPSLAVGDPVPIPVTPGVQVSLPLQNAFYALQWFVFAAFAVALWGVWVWREAVERSTEADASVHA